MTENGEPFVDGRPRRTAPMRRARAVRRRSRGRGGAGGPAPCPAGRLRRRAAPRRRAARRPAGAGGRRSPAGAARAGLAGAGRSAGAARPGAAASPGRRCSGVRRHPAVPPPRPRRRVPRPSPPPPAARRARRVDRQADPRRSVRGRVRGPRPGPRALGLVDRRRASRPLGIVEGPASATTKAPAAVAALWARAALVGDLSNRAVRDAAVRVPPAPVAGAPLRDRVELAAPLPGRRPRAATPPTASSRSTRAAAARRPHRGRAGLGTALAALVVGPGTEAPLVRADGALVRVPGVSGTSPTGTCRSSSSSRCSTPAPPTTATPTAALDRRAGADGAGRHLALRAGHGTLHRSESLQELYRGEGVEPDGSGGPVEGEQVALLVRALRSGTACRRPPAPSWRCPACPAQLPRRGGARPGRRARPAHRRRPRHHGAARDRGPRPARGPPLRRPRRAGAHRHRDRRPRRRTSARRTRRCARCSTSPRSSCAGCPSPRCPPSPSPIRARPRWTARCTRRCRAGCARAARRRAPLPGRGRPAAARRRHHRLVRAGRLGHDARRRRLALAAGLHRHRRAAPRGRAAAQRRDRRRADPPAQPGRDAWSCSTGCSPGPARDRVAVVCGDIDDFQRVNSALGHEAGDDLLVTLAGRLQRELPVGCTAARLAADEFVVVCSDLDEAGGPDALAATVGDLLRTTVTVRGRPVQLTASVGRGRAAGGQRGRRGRPAALRRGRDARREADLPRRVRAGDGPACSAPRPTTLELEAELRAAIAADGAGAGVPAGRGPGRARPHRPRRWSAGRTRSTG